MARKKKKVAKKSAKAKKKVTVRKKRVAGKVKKRVTHHPSTRRHVRTGRPGGYEPVVPVGPLPPGVHDTSGPPIDANPEPSYEDREVTDEMHESTGPSLTPDAPPPAAVIETPEVNAPNVVPEEAHKEPTTPDEPSVVTPAEASSASHSDVDDPAASKAKRGDPEPGSLFDPSPADEEEKD